MPADSPTRARNTHISKDHSHCVEESRASLAPDISEIPEVALPSLLTAVLPDVSSGQDHLDCVCEKAVSRGFITERDGNSRWACLPHDPNDICGSATTVFRFVDQIFTQIRSLLSRTQPLIACRIDGDHTLDSDRDNSSRPDGYICLSVPMINGEVREDWENIVMPMGFKKDSDQGPQIDNFGKVTWSMRHGMRADPTRRFIFGFTIESTTARLWFQDRFDVVTSTPFDINKEWRVLTQIMLAIMRARREELGYAYDTGLRVVPGLLPRHGDISVRERTGQASTTTVHRTVGSLSTLGADCFFGRGTRVWIVRELANGALTVPRYALKDVWVHPGRLVEHQVLKKVKNHQEASYFIMPVTAGFVPSDPSHPDELDDSWWVIRQGRALTTTGKALRIHLPSTTPSSTPRSSNKDVQEGKSLTGGNQSSVGYSGDVGAPYEQGHRGSRGSSRHSRLMDEGVALWRIKRFPHLLRVLRDGMVGLAGIARKGKVHRDISEGNIFCSPFRIPSTDDGGDTVDFRSTGLNDLPLVPEQGIIQADTYEDYVKQRYAEFGCIGRLYDLEFMVELKQPDNEARRMQRTGTPAFISAQLLAADDDKPMRHTFLHDLESFFWVLIWMVATHLEPGKKLSCSAQVIIDSLCRGDDQSLAEYKELFLYKYKAMCTKIVNLGNGWEEAGPVVFDFSLFLLSYIYTEGHALLADESDNENDDKTVCGDTDPWPIIKSVINIFDKHITRLDQHRNS